MNVKSTRFKVVDILLLAGAILPILAIITLKVLFSSPAEGIEITGAMVYFTIPMPIQPLLITEALINSWAVMLTILFLCLYLTHGITAVPVTKRQLAAEWVVDTCNRLVEMNMGSYFKAYPPFIAGIMALSALSSLSSLLGVFPPTSDINIVGGWAILTFGLITYYKLKCGLLNYLKGFTEPIVVLLPLNILGEVASPLSLAFRHYGNILSGSVIAVLLAAAFTGVSNMLLGWLPGVLGDFPLFRIGIPAVLSLYFDIFSGGLQAFIFATLTMMYVSGGFPQSEFEARKAKREAKKAAKAAAKAAKAA
jgi:F-type H+-transporting ATPase subunit a